MPKCFKPGHIDPHDQTTVEGVGWLVKGKGGSSVVVSMRMGKWCFLGGKSYVCDFFSVFLGGFGLFWINFFDAKMSSKNP